MSSWTAPAIPTVSAASRSATSCALITIVDIYSALVEKRAYRLQFTHAKAFLMMEEMGDKLDQQLLQAFRPVAFGH